ncbi:MAG: BamA/TamA family outer membrane protein, partial [Parachlamydiales bacterium]
ILMLFFKKYLFLLFLIPIYAFSLEYSVVFFGIGDKNTLDAIEKVSNLIILQKRPPKTSNALRYRANSDIAEIKKILHSLGYYDAEVKVDLEETEKLIKVNVFITPGTRYTIKEINLYSDCIEKKKLEIANVTLNDLDLRVSDPVVTENIISNQDKLLFLLSSNGYPLSKIEKLETKIDLSEKTAYLDFCVQTGPFSKFGNIKISGLKDIDQSVIFKKIKWNKNQTYDVRKIIETQRALLKTNLFSSVAILNDQTVDKDDQLGINIKLAEALHKYFSPAISYATVDGFGASIAWGNRNFRSRGELLALEAEVAQRIFFGIATYKITDFLKTDQNYVLRLAAQREKIPYVYLAFTYSMINRIDRLISKNLLVSLGFKVEYDEITHSGNNGDFLLLGVPFYLKYSNANNLLNPTKGNTFIYYASPYQNVINEADFFFKQTFTYNIYLPFGKSEIFVLAVRTQLGNMIGSSVFNMPLTKLFLGGSDDDLRGYKYRTVSPLNEKREPIGGKSAIYVSIEPRFKITKTIGLVPFTDLGIVSLKQFPAFEEKWFKSVGIGVRYYSFFGPIRLDVGFPLDRRKNIDPRYKIYVNIGQTF